MSSAVPNFISTSSGFQFCGKFKLKSFQQEQALVINIQPTLANLRKQP